VASTDPIVGIDLGTSNSCVALVTEERGEPAVLADAQNRGIIPSVVSFHPNGDVLVGAEAKQRRIIDPRNTVYSVKRIMGRVFSAPEVAACARLSSFAIKEGANQQPMVATRAGDFAVPEISAIILDHLRQIARQRLGGECKRAVITVPANFNDAQRQATATAGAIAELVVVRILNEPTAAALAYGHGRQLSQIVAVYDFGGGTFDITLLALRDNVYEVLATAGDTFLGGDDIDDRLVEILARAFLKQHRIDLHADEIALQRLRATAEMCKCELSEQPRTVARIPEVAIGAGGRPIDLEYTVPREGFIEHVADIIDRSFPVCDEALRLAQLAITQIDEVVLVGGTTRIPYLRERVAKYFGRTPRVDVNPDEAVALGAALQAAALAQVLDKRSPLWKQPRGAPGAARPARRTTTMAALPPLPPGPQSQAAAPAIGRVATRKVSLPVEGGAGGGKPDEVTEVVRFVSDEIKRPVLLDVVPRGLAVGTVGGFCEEIVSRNSPIPTEQSRVFTTARDNQTSVEVRVCQGESRRFDDNVLIGTVALDGVPPRPRGMTRIVVTFEINTDGILEVRAHDQQTGSRASVKIQIAGAQSAEEIGVARDRLRGLRTET
jgi:molecular chaperone DnaK